MSIDLSECEREPIARLGLVQPHGALLLIGEDDGCIRGVSDTIEAVVGIAATAVLGRPLEELLGREAAQRIAQAPAAGEQVAGDCFAVGPRGGADLMTATAHRHAGQLVLELERRGGDEEDRWREWAAIADDVLARVRVARDPYRFAQVLCDTLHPRASWDRIWVYRFDADWSGDVIAEACAGDLTPFLGLRYPASDIPAQARALYRRNPLRVLADVGATPAGLTGEGLDPPPDLSHAVLRAASPYHIEYLQNLGVGATATASLYGGGELWGMLSFHHRSAHPMPWFARQALLRVARGYSELVERDRVLRGHAVRARADRDLARLQRRLDASPRGWRAVWLDEIGVRELFGADAVAVMVGDAVSVVGEGPDPTWLRSFAGWLAEREEPRLVSARLGDVYPAATPVRALASGAAAVVVSRSPRVVIAAFRAEKTREVYWGGDPDRPAIRDARSQRVSARKSFDLWRATVRGSSRPWDEGTMRRLTVLRDALLSRWDGDAVANERPSAVDRAALIEAATERLALASDDLGAGSGGVLVLRSGSAGGEPGIALADRDLCDLLGRDLTGVTGLEIGRELAHLGLEGLLDAEIWPQTVDVCSPDLGPRRVDVTRRRCFLFSAPGGDDELVAFHFTDTTRSTRLIAALEAARVRTEAADHAKSAMLRNVTHELRTPIHGILGVAEILASDVHVEAQQRELLQEITGAGEQLLGRVETLLDMTEIELGASAVDDEPCDLTALLREAASWVTPLAAAKAISVDTRLPEEAIPFLGRPRAIRQMLAQLLGNAVKFTPMNGRIGLRASLTAGGDPSVEVWDTGIGIAEEHQRRIFERFFQVEMDTTRPFEGMGLGLSLVQAYVVLHGGTITVQSSPGRGTAFRIVLPQARMAAAAVDPPSTIGTQVRDTDGDPP